MQAIVLAPVFRFTQRLAALSLALAVWSCAHAADTPVVLSQLALHAPAKALSVSADGSRVLIQTRPASGHSSEILIIDASDLSHLGVRERLATSGAGQLAISDDGRHALLVESSGESQPATLSTPGTYKVMLIDLSDPTKPRESWVRSINAAAVALAPDASAVAYTRRSQSKGGHNEVVVLRSDGTQDTRLGSHDIGNLADILLSAGARFIAVNDFGWTVQELASDPSAAFTRKQSGMASQGCMMSIQPSGHVVVEDRRAPRLGIYAPQRNLPRIAKVTHATGVGSSCQFTTLARAGGLLLLRHRSGNLYRLDMSDALRPQLSKPLLLPKGSTPAGLDMTGRIYALGTNAQGESQLKIYDARRTALLTVDWVALERARREALRIYEDKSLSTFSREWGALNKLEDAGAIAALNAPVSGISNRAAAAILNDYAFLLGKDASFPGNPDVQALLRRAIELDPGRRIAYLNLAEELRRSLPSASASRETVLAQARASYAKYLALGGSPLKEMLVLMDDRLERQAQSDICGAIANFANAGRLGELIRSTATDVPAGGKKLDLVFATEGTAHVPVLYAWDAADDSPLDEVPASSSKWLWGGDELGLVMYGGAAHILHYRDTSHPVASAATSGGQACHFHTMTVEQAAPDALEPGLCAQLKDGDEPDALEFDGPARMTSEDINEVYGETGLSGSRKIDVANDGTPINIGEFRMISSAGAGCDESFFDELDDTAAHFQQGPRRGLLMGLQGADVRGRYPVLPCGNQPRFFVHKGRVYFETKPAQWPPIDQWNAYHRVTRIREGTVEDVCRFSFKSEVKVGKRPRSQAQEGMQ